MSIDDVTPEEWDELRIRQQKNNISVQWLDAEKLQFHR